MAVSSRYGTMVLSEKTEVTESASLRVTASLGYSRVSAARSFPFCASLMGSRKTTCLLLLTLRPGLSVVAGCVGVRIDDWALHSFTRFGVAGGCCLRHQQRQGVKKRYIRTKIRLTTQPRRVVKPVLKGSSS